MVDEKKLEYNAASLQQRALWLCIWEALTIVQKGLARYLKLKHRCRHCGNDL